MMIKAVAVSCWLLLLAVPFPVAAQDLPVTFRDDFSTSAFGWPQGRNRSSYAEIKDGVYHCASDNRTGIQYLQAPVTYVDYSEDFDVEIRVRWLSGRHDVPFGIAFAAAGPYDHSALVINARGEYRFQQYVQRQYQEITDWFPNGAIDTMKQWNTITLKKRGTAVNAVINGYTIGSVEAPQVLGRGFGIVTWERIEIEVDEFIIRQKQQMIRLAPDHPTSGTRENLGPNVNTTGGDLSPVITADGRFLFIGRYPFAGNIGNPQTEDIYVSEYQADGTWGKTQNVGRPLNNAGSNYLISITPDLNTALVGNTYYPNGAPRGGGVSVTYRTEDGWMVPQAVRIDNYYNQHRFAEMCLDPSGTHLIMAIQREDTEGEKDLYVSHKRDNGSFTEPENIRGINTWGNEMSPFVAADGETMYFATDGRKGYGGTDIWMTRRLDDTWLNWSEPENLGPIINTEGWDAYYTVPARGDYAYLSATNPQNGSADIYRVKLTEGVKPKPVVLVRGRVLDATTKKPVAALVNYESLSKRTKVGEARSAPKDGAYAIALPAGDLYGFRASADGYYPVSDQLSTKGLGEYAEIERDLYLVPLRKNETIRLNNLFFDTGESELRPESLPELDRLVLFLQQRPQIVIELSGHTDNVGSSASNKALSQERVNAVKTYLVSKGVDTSRLKAVGYGENEPIAPNTTEEGRQQNRRVEFKIVNI